MLENCRERTTFEDLIIVLRFNSTEIESASKSTELCRYDDGSESPATGPTVGLDCVNTSRAGLRMCSVMW